MRDLSVVMARHGAGLDLSSSTLACGRPDEARTLLAPVYGRFSEGFDTPDLQEAKALLDE